MNGKALEEETKEALVRRLRRYEAIFRREGLEFENDGDVEGEEEARISVKNDGRGMSGEGEGVGVKSLRYVETTSWASARLARLEMSLCSKGI